jgi:hypothetical protein
MHVYVYDTLNKTVNMYIFVYIISNVLNILTYNINILNLASLYITCIISNCFKDNQLKNEFFMAEGDKGE